MNDTSKRASLPAVRLAMPETAVREFEITEARWRTLVDAVFPSAKSPEAVVLALDYCRANGLDIMKRPIHIVPMWNSTLRREVETIWPGIASYRIVAHRSESFAGMDDCTFGETKTETFKGEILKRKQGQIVSRKPVEATVEYPEWAQVTVYRIVKGEVRRFPGPKVRYKAMFGDQAGSGVPNDKWANDAFWMLEKCFAPDTEVLTDRGFQRFDQVTGRIMEVTDDGLQPTDAMPFRQTYDGPMVVCEGQSLNFAVTPNHDMVTVDHGKVEAGTILAMASSRPRYRIPLTAPAKAKDARWSDGEISLSAMVLCDGWRHEGRSGAREFCIAVSRRHKIDALVDLNLHHQRHTRPALAATASSGRVITAQHDQEVFVFKPGIAALLDSDKRPLLDEIAKLSARQARLFVDTMIDMDGTTMENGVRRFYSSDEDVCAAFELAAVIAGYAVSPRRPRESDIGTKPNFCITVSMKQSAPVYAESPSIREKIDAGARSLAPVVHSSPNDAGEVWCCTVPSGVIVVRRHGLSMLCGNCAEAAALRRAFPEALGDWQTIEEAERTMVDVTPQGGPEESADDLIDDTADKGEDKGEDFDDGLVSVVDEVGEVSLVDRAGFVDDFKTMMRAIGGQNPLLQAQAAVNTREANLESGKLHPVVADELAGFEAWFKGRTGKTPEEVVAEAKAASAAAPKQEGKEPAKEKPASDVPAADEDDEQGDAGDGEADDGEGKAENGPTDPEKTAAGASEAPAGTGGASEDAPKAPAPDVTAAIAFPKGVPTMPEITEWIGKAESALAKIDDTKKFRSWAKNNMRSYERIKEAMPDKVSLIDDLMARFD